MEKIYEKVLCSIMIFIFAFFGIMSEYALANFPDTIGPISRSSNAAYPKKNGIDFFGQQYKYDTTSGKAVFCVEYSKGFVANDVCQSLLGSNQDWSTPTKAGIAYIIRTTNFGNPQPSSVTSAQLETNLNISLALNQFLIEVGEGGYYNKIPYDVDVNQFIPASYRTIINDAKSEYNRVKKVLQGNENEKLDVDVSLHKRYQSEKSSITYNPVSSDNEIDKIFVVTAPVIDNSTLTARVNRGGTLPANVEIRVYSGSSLDNMPTRPSVTFTSSSQSVYDIAVNANSKTNYIRFEFVDNRTDKSEALKVYPSVTAFKSTSYYIAQKYDCGDDEQSLTPNITEKVTLTENDSASMSIKTVGIPDYPSLKIVKKQENTDNYLSGAKFNIIKNPNSEDKTIISKYTNSNGEINYDSLEEAEYCIIETRAPSGYLLDSTRHCFGVQLISSGTSNTVSVDTKNDSKISYDSTNSVITITLSNQPNLIKLGKKVKIDGVYQYVDGATLKVTTERNRDAAAYVHNNETLMWSTSDVLVKNISGLPIGTYYLYEMEAPEGYSLNPDPVKITVSNTDTQEKSFFIKNQKTSVKIRKVDASTPAISLSGAKLRIVDSNNNVVSGPWTSDNSDHVVTGLAPGDYWLEELNPPKGYSKVQRIKFTINEYGDVLVNNSELETQTVILSNQKNEVYVTKTDITGANTIEGAKLQILDSNNNPVKLKKVGEYLEPDDSGDEYWISSDKPEKIKGLPAGKYQLKEILAPDGYVLSTEVISFEIDIDGKVKVNNNVKESKTLIMTNDFTKVYISKQDITNKGVELPGATLVLENSDGVEIERWESGNEPHLIEGLRAGTYKLTEIISPDGYTKNEESITFTIDENGVVTGDTVMYNTPIPDVPSTGTSTSILIIFVGLSLLGLGVGLYAYGFKKKTEV